MKSSSLLFFLPSLAGVQAFAPQPLSQRIDSAVNMGGFLDGRVPKNDIMKKEDDAMWVDDGSQDSKSGGWNPFEIAKNFENPKKAKPAAAAAKKQATPPPKKNAGGFKMPWDK